MMSGKPRIVPMDKEKMTISEENQVFHMWEPMHFEVGHGYNYRRDSLIWRFVTSFFQNIASAALLIIDGVLFGMRIKGRKYLKEIRHTGAVTVSNHIHPMDCTMINVALWGRKRYFVSLESNFRIPVARHLIRLLGAVPMSSKSVLAIEMFSEMEKALQKKALVHIFPEGVMVPYAKGIRPLKNGAFRLAFKAGVPILPIAVTQHEPSGLWRFFKKKPCLHIEILPPLFLEDEAVEKKTAGGLRQACRNLFEDVLNR